MKKSKSKSDAPERDHIDEMLDEEDMEEAPEKSETELLAEKLKEAEDKLLRQAADADNYRKRLIRETDDKIKYANQAVLEKFLPVLDNFDLALQHAEGADAKTVLEGVRLNRNVMLDVIEKAGMEMLTVTPGDPFNPAEHEAITLCNNSDMPDNAVAMVIRNGYKMSDRIVRPAKVQVNKCK